MAMIKIKEAVGKNGYMPFWWGNKFNKRLAMKRERQACKKLARNGEE